MTDVQICGVGTKRGPVNVEPRNVW